MPDKKKPILCVDFDGVIHSYISEWQGATMISDRYIPGFFAWAIETMKYFQLAIYSSRSKEPGAIEAMRAWLRKEFDRAIYEEELTHENGWVDFIGQIIFPVEKPPAFLTIDDRAIVFRGNWNDPALSVKEMFNYKPWNK